MSKTQCKRVILYLEENKSLTSKKASTRLGIDRLSARIYELSQIGYVFNRQRKRVKNRFGEKCLITEYSIASQP